MHTSQVEFVQVNNQESWNICQTIIPVFTIFWGSTKSILWKLEVQADVLPSHLLYKVSQNRACNISRTTSSASSHDSLWTVEKQVLRSCFSMSSFVHKTKLYSQYTSLVLCFPDTGENTLQFYLPEVHQRELRWRHGCFVLGLNEVTDLSIEISIIRVHWLLEHMADYHLAFVKASENTYSVTKLEMPRDRDGWPNTEIQAFLLLYSSCLWAHLCRKAVFE